MRLFIAAELSDEVRSFVDRQLSSLSRTAPDARFVASEKLHLTLQFLGEVDETRVPPLVEAVQRAVAGTGSLKLWLEHAGAFGAPHAPSVLWLDVAGEVARLSALQRRLVEGTAALGFEDDRRGFTAHLTLARSKDRRGDPAFRRCVEKLTGAKSPTFDVNRLVLVRSVLGSNGGYSVVAEWPLARPTSAEWQAGDA